MKRAAMCLCLCIFVFRPALAQQTGSSVLQDVGINQKLGAQIDLKLRFRDESGTAVTLSKYFNGKPVIFAPVYFSCPSLCPMSLNSMIQALRTLTFNAGKEFIVIAFSFDPKETPPFAWYVAFAPADNPQIAVAVVVESKDVAATGGKLSAAVGRATINALVGGS